MTNPTPAPTGDTASLVANATGASSAAASGAVGTNVIDGPVDATGAPVSSSAAFDAARGGSGTSVFSTEPTIPVWRDTKTAPAKRRKYGGTISAEYRSETGSQMTSSQAQGEFGTMLQDGAKLKQFVDLALKAGLINPDQSTDVVALSTAWDRAISFAFALKQSSKSTKEYTPFEALKQVAQVTGAAALAQQQDIRAHLNGVAPLEHATDTYVTKTDTAAAGNTLHQLLGRNPTAGEEAAYQHGLQSIAAQHPTVVQHMGTYKDGVLTAQTDTATGGYDENAAQRQVASSVSPEVAQNQAATTYMDALRTAVQAVD